MASAMDVERLKIVHFGHSFPRRLYRIVLDHHTSINQLMDYHDGDIFLAGYSGLTYDRIFSNPEKYLQHLLGRHIDILTVDLGTNDLCSPENSPADIVQKCRMFLQCLKQYKINPRVTVFLTVIQRNKMTYPGSVPLNVFNRKVHRFNGMLARDIGAMFPEVQVWPQTQVNHLRYIQDGCHLTDEGMEKYVKSLKHLYISIGHGLKEGQGTEETKE